MSESHDETAARAFRPSRKPMWIAVLANGLLFCTLVLWPYVRGHLRAADTRERFAEFAACFWGGRAVDDPGLELPPGERERYESRVLQGEPDWPARCREPLERVAPDEPWLLFPGTKSAEEQVRAGVALVDGELEALAEAREAGEGSVPHRPYLAVGRLMATLSALHEVTGAQDAMAGPAIEFDEAPSGIPRPARVPLQAARDATVRWMATAEGLHGTATDRRGISRVRVVGDGRVDARRIPRPGLVRGVVLGPELPWLVWAMPPDRCAEEEDGCANNALGLAPYGDDVIRTPEPRWYAGHPAGRIDRVVHVGGGVVTMVALHAGDEGEPTASLRRFPLDPPEETAEEATGEPLEVGADGEDGDAPRGPRPVAAATRTPLEGFGPGDAALVTRGPEPLTVWSARSEGRTTFRALGPEQAEPTVVGGLDGERPFLFACEAEGTRWLVLGTQLGLRVARLAGGSARADPPALGRPVPLGLEEPVAPEDPEDDRVRVVCDADRADVLVLRDHGLDATRCDAEGRCSEPARVATDVFGFDAARSDGTTMVAWAGEGAAAEVHVRPLSGEPGTDTVPAACWQNERGFCGAPMLRAAPGRVLLAAREGTDMLVVESPDGGASWRTMRGIE